MLLISIYLAGEQCILRNLIGSTISEYSALFTSNSVNNCLIISEINGE